MELRWRRQGGESVRRMGIASDVSSRGREAAGKLTMTRVCRRLRLRLRISCSDLLCNSFSPALVFPPASLSRLSCRKENSIPRASKRTLSQAKQLVSLSLSHSICKFIHEKRKHFALPVRCSSGTREQCSSAAFTCSFAADPIHQDVRVCGQGNEDQIK